MDNKTISCTHENDLISRQAAIDAIGEKSDEIYKTKQKGATYPHDAFFQGMAYAENVVKQLPSAQPKKGKWIYHIYDLFPAESTMECNQCHAEQPLTCDDEFCPHCGAKMEVTE